VDKRIFRKTNGVLRAEIEKASRLHRHFSKGCVLVVVTVGKTWKASDQECSDSGLQRQVLAPYHEVGQYCTEITAAAWLKRPFKTRGNQGKYYDVRMPNNYLPSLK
jgi:hypothetical protein